jgi:hypothetical protein
LEGLEVSIRYFDEKAEDIWYNWLQLEAIIDNLCNRMLFVNLVLFCVIMCEKEFRSFKQITLVTQVPTPSELLLQVDLNFI